MTSVKGNVQNGYPPSIPNARIAYAMSGGALVLASRDKVDYSVTKGGLRLWAVLFVFIVLCSSIYTIISQDMMDIALDLDDDGDLDDDADDDDALQEKRFAKDKERDTTPSKDSSEKYKHPPSDHKFSSHEVGEGEASDDDEDDVDEEHQEEDIEVESPGEEPSDIPLIKETPRVSKSEKKTERKVASKPPPLDDDDEVNEAELLAALKDRAKARLKLDSVQQIGEMKRKEKKSKDRKKQAQKLKDGDDEEAEEEDMEAVEEVEEQDPGEAEQEKRKEKPKVRVIRTKGKAPEPRRAILKRSKEDEEPEKQEHEDEEPKEQEHEVENEEPEENPPRKKVKVFRTKGTAALKKEKVATVSKPRDIDDKSCEKGKCGEEDDQEEEEEDHEQEEDVSEEIEEESKAPAHKKVRVFRTKGIDPKQESLRPKNQINRHANLNDEIDEDGDEDVDPKIQRVKSSDLHIQKLEDSKQHIALPKYKKHSITNREDNHIKERLDKAEQLLDQHEHEKGLAAFDILLKSYPDSPRGHYGKARALDLLSEKRQSNQHLDLALQEYQMVVDNPSTPDGLLLECGQHLVSRYRFRGWLHKSIKVQRLLIDQFPDQSKLRNELGVSFLIMNRMQDAKKVFQDILKLNPNDALAQVHYGFILKTVDDKLKEAVDFMAAGMASGEEGTQDARFFYHLGDALQRLGRQEEAYKLYEKGVEKGLFLSKYQRSLYNVKGLTARPWWTLEQTNHAKQLKRIEKEWKAIRDEAVALLDKEGTSFMQESEKLVEKGDWKQFPLFARGKKNEENCKKAPKTCAIVSDFEDAVNCTRGQIKFSLLQGGSRVWAHCGPTNCRVRAHLGLVVPPEPRIKVAEETRAWKQGKFIVLDDSFEHQVWHEGKTARLILIVDFWHPEVTEHQKKTLAPI